MPRIIAQNRIPRVNLANRSIAFTPGAAAPAGALGVGIGGSIWAATSPGSNWVAADAMTEATFALMRTTGALPATPQIGRHNPMPGASPFPWTSTTQQANFPFSASRLHCASGNGFTAISPSGQSNAANACSFLVLTPVHYNLTGSILNPNLISFAVGNAIGAQSNTPVGTSFALGEFHQITNYGLFSNPPVYGAVATRYGLNAPQNDAIYNQISGIGVNYVLYCSGNLLRVPRYGTDRINWTLCTLPALNGDGTGTHNWITWIVLDSFRNRLVAVTKYGEILTSLDGITFTKTSARVAGGTSYDMGSFVITASGKLFAVNSSPINGGYLMAADVGSQWQFLTVVLPGGKTFLTRAFGVAYTAGVVGLNFQATTATPTSTALTCSVDDGATWVFVTGGDGSAAGVNSGQSALLGEQGVFAGLTGLAGADFTTNFGDRAPTDADTLVGYAQVAPTFQDWSDGGLVKKRYFRVR